ncbi:MAG: hypothetical protein GKR90_00385 [Pseudomonadales bacterium]|nr:hypothetical protein [Pseudomonadales bacterium]
MTPEQAKRFHRDGFLVLPKAVPANMAIAARRLLFEQVGSLRNAIRYGATNKASSDLAEAAQAAFRSGGDPRFMDLFNQTNIKRCLEKALGDAVREVRGAQLATLYPDDRDKVTNETGYQNRDTPHNQWAGHLDGLWNGGTPPPRAGTNIRGRHLAAWQVERSTNGGRLTFPEFNANIANFTALVGVALSDQRALGCGNLGLLKGGHKHMETFFQSQDALGGPLGPDGPDWPREDRGAPNRHGLRHYPDKLRELYANKSVRTPDGKIWPKPTLMRLNMGDAVIAHFSTPHGGTSVTTSDPRFMVYFRCTSSARAEENVYNHPDALLDNWLEWPGVRRALKLKR